MGDYEALSDVWRAVAEGELAEDAVREGFAEGFGKGDVGGEEDDVGYVGGCYACRPCSFCVS